MCTWTSQIWLTIFNEDYEDEGKENKSLRDKQDARDKHEPQKKKTSSQWGVSSGMWHVFGTWCSETTYWSHFQGSKCPHHCENLKTHKTSWCHMPLLWPKSVPKDGGWQEVRWSNTEM